MLRCPDCKRPVEIPKWALGDATDTEHKGWRLVLLARHRTNNPDCPGNDRLRRLIGGDANATRLTTEGVSNTGAGVTIDPDPATEQRTLF